MARKKTSQPGTSVEADFTKGIVRDSARVAIPEGGVYDSEDFLLHQPGVAQKRGGTSYAGPALTDGSSPAASCVRVAFAEFPAGSQLIAVGDNAHLYKVTSSTTTDVAALGSGFDWDKAHATPVQPLLAIDKLIVTATDGTTSPKKYDGSTVSSLGGSPPAGIHQALYKSRLVLGNTLANPNRLFFSPAPDIEGTWDTSNAWIDCDYAISGLAATSNQLLVFSQGHTERIVGSTPPPNSDMDRTVVGSVGCTDPRSIVSQENNILFANPRGVYLTNGAGFASLTTEGNIESYWQMLLDGYDAAAWTIAAGIHRSFYFVTVIDDNDVVAATLMCYVPRRAWWRVSNIGAMMYAQAVGEQEELYYADAATNRVGALSGILSPSSANKNDADGTAVTPSITLRPVGDGTGIKTFGFGRVTYDMRDASSDNPSLAVTALTGVEADTSETVPESPLGETATADRRRFSVFKDAQAVSLKFEQTNASSKTEIYAVEVEQHAYSITADGVG